MNATTAPKCGNWKCARDAALVRVSAIERGKALDGSQAIRGLLCNVHAAAERRRTYGGDHRFVAIDDASTEAVVTAARVERERVAKEQAADRARRDKEEAERQARLTEYYWTERDGEPEYEVLDEVDEHWAGEPDRKVAVYPKVGKRDYPTSSAKVGERDDSRPAYVEQSGSSHMTPRQARAHAEALIRAADMAEAETAKRREARMK